MSVAKNKQINFCNLLLHDTHLAAELQKDKKDKKQ